MKTWQEDLLDQAEGATCEHELFKKITDAAQALGFEHCAYGLRVPLPLSSPKTIMQNNYPKPWQERYAYKGYLFKDPTVLHGRRSQSPLVWCNKVFGGERKFWDEAQSFGLRFGWVQSSLDAMGVGGMLTLSRPNGVVSEAELESNQIKMRWLVHVSHLALSKIFIGRQVQLIDHPLTAREVEVLKWTADGKTSGEVSEILCVSENTVNFHVKNAVAKLRTANKTAAVVKAAMLGLLN